MNKSGSTVYLLKVVNQDGCLYKIGHTRGPVTERIKNIQTGCPHEINIEDTYFSKYGIIIEKTLHNIYSHKKTHGEWFDLTLEDVSKFQSICEQYHNIQEFLNAQKITP